MPACSLSSSGAEDFGVYPTLTPRLPTPPNSKAPVKLIKNMDEWEVLKPKNADFPRIRDLFVFTFASATAEMVREDKHKPLMQGQMPSTRSSDG